LQKINIKIKINKKLKNCNLINEFYYLFAYIIGFVVLYALYVSIVLIGQFVNRTLRKRTLSRSRERLVTGTCCYPLVIIICSIKSQAIDWQIDC